MKARGHGRRERARRLIVPLRRSIVFKQALIFLLTIIPSLCTFLVVYSSYHDKTMQTITETTLSRDRAIFEEVTSSVSGIVFQMYDFYNEGDLYLLSDMWERYTEKERAAKIVSIQDKLQWMNSGESIVNLYRVYMLRQNVEIYQNGYRAMPEEKQAKIRQIMETEGTIYVSGGVVYVYVRSQKESSLRSLRFVCEIEIPTYKFRQLLADIGPDADTRGLLLVNGEPYMSRNMDEATQARLMEHYAANAEALDEEGTFQLRLDGQDYFGSAVRDENYDFVLLTLRTYDNVFNEVTFNIVLLVVVLLLTTAAAFVFLAYINRYVNRPIAVLGNAFARLNESGEAAVRIEETSKDEFNVLYGAFNDMSERLDRSIRENYLKTIELQRAELKQLQAQIDPHFLYNTLFIIQRRVTRGDYDGAAQLSELLGSYFRYLNRGNRDYMALKDEVRHAYSYIQIQSVRFDGRFTFQGQPCPPQFEDVLVPRMILQPLAENAIEYGMREVEENGRIRVGFEVREGKLLVVVEDSGQADDARIEAMNRRAQGEDGGEISSTVNIMRRLKLFYGDDYHLYYEHSPLGGVRAVVELDTERRRTE